MAAITPHFVPVLSETAGAAHSQTPPSISGKQRQLLRLIDGRRNLAQIAVMMPGRDLVLEIAELQQKGFIVAGEAPQTNATKPPADKLPASWIEASAYMKIQARNAMGLMSQPLIQLIEKVRNPAAARSAVARWHMALRESRNGRDHADEHLERVTSLLGF